LGGNWPSEADRDAEKAVTASGDMPSVKDHPYTYAWFSFASKFNFTPTSWSKAIAAGAAKPKAATNVADPFLDELEAKLASGPYLAGNMPGEADKEAVAKVQAGVFPNPLGYPYTFAWFSLAGKMKPSIFAMGPQKAAAAAEEEKPKAEAAEEDDEMDLFGSDEEEESADAIEDRMLRMAEIKNKGKKVKVVATAKSMILFEVKPFDSETDLDVIKNRIFDNIAMEGLQWKAETKKVPVAFGIFKLIVGCTIEDLKVSTDDLQEAIEAFDDIVQSVDIAAFNKV